MKRVVIVGGGYAGTALARSLDNAADVVLVEPRDRFLHNVAAIRAIVEPVLFDRIALPYDKLLKRGQVLRDRATAVTGKSVSLANGIRIEADVVVVATGSHYARPFKPDGDTVVSLQQQMKAAHARVNAANSIAIIGAGAVGTELAGEIASAMQGKKITLVSSTMTLFPGYTPALGEKLATQLKGLGVTIRTDATAVNLKSVTEPFSGTVELRSGEKISADVIFPVIGARPENTLLRSTAGISFDAIGRAVVDQWMRPSKDESLFAFGDAAATGDAMTIVGISRQQPWLTNTIKAVLKGRKVEACPPYKPWPAPPILIPLGPRLGASVLPFTRNGITVGPFLTSVIKGKQLFIPRLWKEFGYG